MKLENAIIINGRILVPNYDIQQDPRCDLCDAEKECVRCPTSPLCEITDEFIGYYECIGEIEDIKVKS